MSISHISLASVPSDAASRACFLFLLSSQDVKHVLSHRLWRGTEGPSGLTSSRACGLPQTAPRQHSRLNYCLHLICCLNTKLLSASYFLLPPRHRPEHVRVHEEPPSEFDPHFWPRTCSWSSAQLFTSSSV